MAITVTKILEQSYLLLGVDNPDTTQLDTGLNSLNDLIAEWAGDEIISPTVFYSLDDEVDFPVEFFRAIRYNLAVDLGPHGKNLPATVFEEAKKLKKYVRRLNYEPIKPVRHDPEISRNSRFHRVRSI